MSKAYELTVLIHPDLETDLETPLGKVRDIVKAAGGTITTEDNWGKKRLSIALRAKILPCMSIWKLNFRLTHH